jgi:hypothetical protein
VEESIYKGLKSVKKLRETSFDFVSEVSVEDYDGLDLKESKKG